MPLCTRLPPSGTQDMRNRELNNGRFAMVATSGILLAEILSGEK